MGHGQLWSCFASWACASFYRQERGREGSTGERRRVQVTRRPCMRRARDPTRRGGNVSAGVAHLADGMRAALHSSSQPAYVARSVSSPHSCACSTIEGCSADGCSQPRNAHAKPSGCKEARACSPMKAHNPKRSGDSAGCLLVTSIALAAFSTISALLVSRNSTACSSPAARSASASAPDGGPVPSPCRLDRTARSSCAVFGSTEATSPMALTASVVSASPRDK
mmetsp:Transcript_6259/g.14446  ORF Transcript_6259/g.14446 Transcript_6259/m.14446 type:complete len:224 (-) Transcript_6259:3083-3754(-)